MPTACNISNIPVHHTPGGYRRRIFQSLWGLALVTALTACGGIHPRQPDIAPLADLPAPQKSTLTVPIELDLSHLAEQVDTVLGDLYYVSGKSMGDGKTVQLGLRRSGPTRISTDGGCLSLAVPLAIYDGRLDWKVRVLFADVNHHMDFGGAGLVQIRACMTLDAQWQLQAQVQPQFSWTEGAWVDLNPPFGHIKIGVADLVDGSLREKLPAVANLVSSQLSQLPVRAWVERAWIAAQRPVSLAHTPEVTLEFVPASLGLDPPRSVGQRLQWRPAVSGTLQVHTGAGGARPVQPLPPNAGSPPADGFVMQVRADASFTELNALARQELVGKPIDLGGGQMVTPEAITISPSGRALLVKVDFHANLHTLAAPHLSGWLYLSGTPRYDDAKRLLRVDDLDFDVQTKSLLVDAASALGRIVFLQRLRSAMVFDVSSHVDPIKARVTGDWGTMDIAPSVRLSGSVDSLDFSDLYIGAQGIAILATAKGTARIDVQPTLP